MMERGATAVDSGFVRAKLKGHVAAKRLWKFGARSQADYWAARCHLLLGETFQAEERLDRAFRSGGLKNLGILAKCGLLKARIMAASDTSPEKRCAYLARLAANARDVQDFRAARVAEWDLARAEAERLLRKRG